MLSITQRHGVTSLLPKGDKPKQFLKNWRPITLRIWCIKIGMIVLVLHCLTLFKKSHLDVLQRDLKGT
jgi:hypothetical protein